MFILGLIINPVAGLGGEVALKGSDGVTAHALALGATPKAAQRMAQALSDLLPLKQQITILTGAGEQGEDLARQLGFDVRLLHHSAQPSSSQDTQALAANISAERADLILFAGGDGTARDLCAVVGEQQAVLGVPAGVKIHSGVYGLTPKAAGLVAAQMVQGELVSVVDAEVRDIDEAAFRQGTVRAKYFGQMSVPEALHYVQAVKMGGREDQQLVIEDIAAECIEQLDDEHQYIMGSGSTVAAVMAQLGLENTLLGVDLIHQGQLIAQDCTAQQLLALAQIRPTKLVLTLIGGQGHLFGRGNQQLSAELIRLIGRDNIIILATKTKLQGLNGQPLVADLGDSQLEARLQGHYRIITGYRDAVLYPLTNPQ